jgi:hypothetical protein
LQSSTLSASLAFSEDFKTVNGKEYKNVAVTRIEPDGIVVKTKSGLSKVYFTELPNEVQRRFNYDPQQAAAFSASQPWIAKGEQSGLRTHSAATEAVSLSPLTKSSVLLLNLNVRC